MASRSADDSERFAERYTVMGAPAALAVETEALGSDYQANGYTTIEQADELGRVCGLAPGQVLVDVGSGCGWPGLYLALKHGCASITIDRVAAGVEVSARRAIRDGQERTSLAIQADATALPLRSASVDVVLHTDLLC